jgi:hypothetical protein
MAPQRDKALMSWEFPWIAGRVDISGIPPSHRQGVRPSAKSPLRENANREGTGQKSRPMCSLSEQVVSFGAMEKLAGEVWIHRDGSRGRPQCSRFEWLTPQSLRSDTYFDNSLRQQWSHIESFDFHTSPRPPPAMSWSGIKVRIVKFHPGSLSDPIGKFILMCIPCICMRPRYAFDAG